VQVVNFDTASRQGEPFDALILSRQYLPNAVARFCTVELKILTAARYLQSEGWQEWDNLVGFRADEPARLAKLRADPSGGTKGIERHAPLGLADIGVQDVLAFWRAQPFDLGLPVVNNKTMHGNCDLCFLKPPAQRLSLIREKPIRAVWWVAKEASIQSSSIEDGARFRKDGPSYAQMLAYSQSQDEMFDPDEAAIDCVCGGD
jgi:3'-phosphoadenosine 5'-phosphosulfate sulfotransferase (PAPS reductase)/FAD synthetase